MSVIQGVLPVSHQLCLPLSHTCSCRPLLSPIFFCCASILCSIHCCCDHPLCLQKVSLAGLPSPVNDTDISLSFSFVLWLSIISWRGLSTSCVCARLLIKTRLPRGVMSVPMLAGLWQQFHIAWQVVEQSAVPTVPVCPMALALQRYLHQHWRPVKLGGC